MTAIAESFGCAALRAAAAYSAGIVQVADGEGATALSELRRSWQLWTGLEAPYEAARARLEIGLVLRAMGDEDSAVAELVAVRKAFAEFGAQPSLVEVERLLPRTLARRADRPGGGGAAPGRDRQEQSGDRGGALSEREDRGPAPEQHLREDRRLVADRGRRVRLRAPADLTGRRARRTDSGDGPSSPDDGHDGRQEDQHGADASAGGDHPQRHGAALARQTDQRGGDGAGQKLRQPEER